MSHIDPESLALEALEGSALDDADAAHLDACDACREELQALTRTVDAGRSRTSLAWETPSASVWDAIAAEVTAESARTSPASRVAQTARHRAPRRRRRPFARVAGLLVAAGAAVAIVVAVVIPRPESLATAMLDGFPAHPGAHGTAELEREPGGSERVLVELDATFSGEGFREVWLLTEDGTALVSLGVLEGRAGSFTVPADVDTALFSVVDISQEPTGGGAEHSGDSIARGRLATS